MAVIARRGIAALIGAAALVEAGCAATAGLPGDDGAISGTISGAVTDGVRIGLSGPSSATTTTVAGHYALQALPSGRYVVTPSLTGYTFSPTARTVNVSGASVGDQDFVATAISPQTFTIFGIVSGDAADGVLITAAGPVSTTTMTVGGHYALQALPSGRYVVTPSLAGYTFSPPELTVDVSGANRAGQDFVATSLQPSTHAIFGMVAGAVVAGVPVLLDGAGLGTTAITDASGNYRFDGIPDGHYTLSAYVPGYSFSGSPRSITVHGSDVGGADFSDTRTATGLAVSGTIAGSPPVVCIGAGAPAVVCGPGAYVEVSGTMGTGIGTTIVLTDNAGRFVLDGLREGNSIKLVPRLNGYTFTPTNRSLTIGTTDVTGQDFVGAPTP